VNGKSNLPAKNYQAFADYLAGTLLFRSLTPMQCSAVQYCTVVYCTLQYKSNLPAKNYQAFADYLAGKLSSCLHPHTGCSTVQYSTVQYSTVQYSTVQYSTVQYSTVLYSAGEQWARDLTHCFPLLPPHSLPVFFFFFFFGLTSDVVNQFKTTWKITFNYLEPVNEPDTAWKKGNLQEGCAYSQAEYASLIPVVAATLKKKGLTSTKLVGIDGTSTATALYTFASPLFRRCLPRLPPCPCVPSQ